MATKRAFNTHVIVSDDFLQLSSTAQNLYFFLNLFADDEGFNGSPRAVMDICKSDNIHLTPNDHFDRNLKIFYEK